MAKMRSPNYPRTDLGSAIEMVKKVYKGQHTLTGAREVIARHLGYETLNGTSLTWIATLTSYGLLEAVEGGLQVSTDAVTIIELPKGHPERVAALVRRANAPKLFSDINQEFGDSLPSDVNLRHSLIKKKFLPKGADEAIRVYRETKSFVYAEVQEYSDPAGEPKGESKPVVETSMQSPRVGQSQQSFGTGTPIESGKFRVFTENGQPVVSRKMTELSFKLSRGSEAKVAIYGDVSQEAIDKFIRHLELSKDSFPLEAEIAAREGYRAAVWKNKDHDQPVTVTGELGKGTDGRNYLKVAESPVGIPEDEIEFTDAKAKGAA